MEDRGDAREREDESEVHRPARPASHQHTAAHSQVPKAELQQLQPPHGKVREGSPQLGVEEQEEVDAAVPVRANNGSAVQEGRPAEVGSQEEAEKDLEQAAAAVLHLRARLPELDPVQLLGLRALGGAVQRKRGVPAGVVRPDAVRRPGVGLGVEKGPGLSELYRRREH